MTLYVLQSRDGSHDRDNGDILLDPDVAGEDSSGQSALSADESEFASYVARLRQLHEHLRE